MAIGFFVALLMDEIVKKIVIMIGRIFLIVIVPTVLDV